MAGLFDVTGGNERGNLFSFKSVMSFCSWSQGIMDGMNLVEPWWNKPWDRHKLFSVWWYGDSVDAKNRGCIVCVSVF